MIQAEENTLIDLVESLKLAWTFLPLSLSTFLFLALSVVFFHRLCSSPALTYVTSELFSIVECLDRLVNQNNPFICQSLNCVDSLRFILDCKNTSLMCLFGHQSSEYTSHRVSPMSMLTLLFPGDFTKIPL